MNVWIKPESGWFHSFFPQHFNAGNGTGRTADMKQNTHACPDMYHEQGKSTILNDG